MCYALRNQLIDKKNSLEYLYYDIERLVAYIISDNPKKDDTTLVCIRNITNLEKFRHKFKNQPITDLTTDGRVYPEKLAALSKVKKIINDKLSDENINIINLKYNDLLTINSDKYLKEIGSFFYKKLTNCIDNATIDLSNYKDLFKNEVVCQAKRVSSLFSEYFIGRENTLEDLKIFMLDDPQVPLVLYGETGIGKRSILIEMSKNIRKWLGDSTISIIRLGGTSEKTSSIGNFLLELCNHIRIVLKVDNFIDSITQKINTRLYFKETLNLAGNLLKSDQHLVIMVSDIHLIKLERGGWDILWIPRLLPSRVHLLVSCDINADNNCLYSLTPHLSYDCLYRIESITDNDASLLIDGLLSINKRTLNEKQKAIIQNSYSIHKNLLALVINVHLSLSWNSWNDIYHLPFSSCLDDVIDRWLEFLESQFGTLFINRSLSFISLMVYGITDTEMLDALSSDDELMNYIYTDYDPTSFEYVRFPEMLWLKLRKSIEPFTRVDISHDYVVICWQYRAIRDRILIRYDLNKFNIKHLIETLNCGRNGRHRDLLLTKRNLKIEKANRGLSFRFIEPNSIRLFNILPSLLAQLDDNFEMLKTKVIFHLEWLWYKLKCCGIQSILDDIYLAEDSHHDARYLRDLILNITDQLENDPDSLATIIFYHIPEAGTNSHHLTSLRKEASDVFHKLNIPLLKPLLPMTTLAGGIRIASIAGVSHCLEIISEKTILIYGSELGLAFCDLTDGQFLGNLGKPKLYDDIKIVGGIIYHTNGRNQVFSWLLETGSFLQLIEVFPIAMRKLIDITIREIDQLDSVIQLMAMSKKRHAVIKINDANVYDLMSKRGLIILSIRERRILSIPPIEAFGKTICDVNYTPTYSDILISLSRDGSKPASIILIKFSMLRDYDEDNPDKFIPKSYIHTFALIEDIIPKTLCIRYYQAIVGCTNDCLAVFDIRQKLFLHQPSIEEKRSDWQIRMLDITFTNVIKVCTNSRTSEACLSIFDPIDSTIDKISIRLLYQIPTSMNLTNKFALIGFQNGHVTIYSLENLTILHDFLAHSDGSVANCLASVENSVIITSSSQNSCHVWHLPTLLGSEHNWIVSFPKVNARNKVRFTEKSEMVTVQTIKDLKNDRQVYLYDKLSNLNKIKKTIPVGNQLNLINNQRNQRTAKKSKWIRNVAPRIIFPCEEYRNRISMIFLSKNDQFLITCRENDSAIVWNLLENYPIFTLELAEGSNCIITILEIIENTIIGLARLKIKCLGQTNILCSLSTVIKIIERLTGKCIMTRTAFITSSPSYIFIDNSLEWGITIQKDNAFVLWQFQYDLTIPVSISILLETIQVRDSGHMITGTKEGCIVHIDLNSPKADVRILGYHTSQLTCLVANNDTIASGDSSGTINIAYFCEDRHLKCSSHTAKINSLALAQEGNLLVSGSDDKYIKIWNSLIGEELWKIKCDSDVFTVGITHHEDYVVTLVGKMINRSLHIFKVDSTIKKSIKEKIIIKKKYSTSSSQDSSTTETVSLRQIPYL
ncbi:DgyrCDS10889 [Dimorphilus gyrociliatus]|uniref:DgyrCDS10889 n=1 Tax=Dimorphilus gyrociliatus TaxID=2664684 RepID=A0A7I8W1R4_9ANNE|nr:DgyrCDS10889 [Dimorphilus gyrociliatus]